MQKSLCNQSVSSVLSFCFKHLVQNDPKKKGAKESIDFTKKITSHHPALFLSIAKSYRLTTASGNLGPGGCAVLRHPKFQGRDCGEESSSTQSPCELWKLGLKNKCRRLLVFWWDLNNPAQVLRETPPRAWKSQRYLGREEVLGSISVVTSFLPRTFSWNQFWEWGEGWGEANNRNKRWVANDEHVTGCCGVVRTRASPCSTVRDTQVQQRITIDKRCRQVAQYTEGWEKGKGDTHRWEFLVLFLDFGLSFQTLKHSQTTFG